MADILYCCNLKKTDDSIVKIWKTKAHRKIVLEDKKKIRKNFYLNWRQSGSLPENLEGRQEKIWKFLD